MAEEVKILRIQNGNQLLALQKSKLDLEERLEDWLTADISVLSDDLLVIDRQTQTDFGGFIDLLCLDRSGDVVIVELKRNKTPREVTAQVLDYASWVKGLSHEAITILADKFLSSQDLTLEVAFEQKFGGKLPEVLNDSHNMLIVGSEIDASTERIIRYLSDEYGVGINVATFQYFKSDSNEELLSRIFLIEPSQVENNTQAKGDSKRRRFLTRQELLEIAKQNGVEDLYQRLVVELDKEFFSGRTLSSHPFLGADNGALHGVVIFSLLPPRSSREEGLHFQIYLDRFATYFKLEKERVIKLLPANKVPWSYHEGAGEYYSGFEGFFADINEVDRFLVGIKSVPQA